MVVEDLIGMKLNLKIKQVQYNGVLSSQYIDDEMQEKISALAPVVRILTPKSRATMDFNPQRLNIYVSDKGVVNKIKYG